MQPQHVMPGMRVAYTALRPSPETFARKVRVPMTGRVRAAGFTRGGKPDPRVLVEGDDGHGDVIDAARLSELPYVAPEAPAHE